MKHTIPLLILFVAAPAALAFSPINLSVPAYSILRSSRSPQLPRARLRGGASTLASHSINGDESSSATWAKDLGTAIPKLLKPDGTSVNTEHALKGKHVGLYFSAHWCPPCRAFTPKLRDTYEAILKSRPDLQIVFVSGDRNQAAFDEYFSSMPWLAVPYSQGTEQLSAKYGIEGFPTLVVIGPDGSVINPDAVGEVAKDSRGEQFPWGDEVTVQNEEIGSMVAEQNPEQLRAMMDGFAGENLSVIFEAANKYGMSALGMREGQQLHNTRKHDDRFRVHRIGDGVYQLESLSAPGLFLGVGPRHEMWYPNNGFTANLMPRSSQCDLRVVPSRNGVSSSVSFEPVGHPGFLLNHCDGLMWFFDAPANREEIFAKDASWGLIPAEVASERQEKGDEGGVISSLASAVSGTQKANQQQRTGSPPSDFVAMDKEKRAHVEVMLERHLRERFARDDVIPGGEGGLIRATQEEYTDEENHTQFVQVTTGGKYEVAEWADLKVHYAAVGKEQFCKDLNLKSSKIHNENLVFVNVNGQSHGSSGRKYFIQRFDGAVPGGWLAHDEIDNGTICLGSWYNLSGCVAMKSGSTGYA